MYRLGIFMTCPCVRHTHKRNRRNFCLWAFWALRCGVYFKNSECYVNTGIFLDTKILRCCLRGRWPRFSGTLTNFAKRISFVHTPVAEAVEAITRLRFTNTARVSSFRREPISNYERLFSKFVISQIKYFIHYWWLEASGACSGCRSPNRSVHSDQSRSRILSP